MAIKVLAKQKQNREMYSTKHWKVKVDLCHAAPFQQLSLLALPKEAYKDCFISIFSFIANTRRKKRAILPFYVTIPMGGSAVKSTSLCTKKTR